MFEMILIFLASVSASLFAVAVYVACGIYGAWKREVSLHAETKRRLEYVSEQSEFWRKMAGEKEDVLSAEIIK